MTFVFIDTDVTSLNAKKKNKKLFFFLCALIQHSFDSRRLFYTGDWLVLTFRYHPRCLPRCIRKQDRWS